MRDYDYKEAMLDDVREYIRENVELADYESREEAEESLYDEMWIADSVTGNGSGSYTFSTYKAEENLCHNLDLLAEAMQEFGDNAGLLEKGAEAADVTIRCYLLGETISAILDEIEQNGEAPEAWNE